MLVTGLSRKPVHSTAASGKDYGYVVGTRMKHVGLVWCSLLKSARHPR